MLSFAVVSSVEEKLLFSGNHNDCLKHIRNNGLVWNWLGGKLDYPHVLLRKAKILLEVSNVVLIELGDIISYQTIKPSIN